MDDEKGGIMSGYIGAELNRKEEEQNENWLNLDSYELLLRYLRKFGEEEREKLKCNLKTLCCELAERQIIVPMDFEPFGDVIYSETLDRELLFFQSSGLIKERLGSIIYKITERGIKLSDDATVISRGVPSHILETLDELIDKLPTDNNENCS
ncbi:MAG: hypothetical protein O8C63_09865 [Candidatus Methanoperedens sp.]|nr:hypothetical protein [Candidatus Methanoperedens sp.]